MGYPALGRFAHSAGLAALALLLGSAMPAAAQTANETKVMVDRLNRLEQELNQLERQVYRGSATPSGAPAQAGAPAGAGGGSESVANFGARLDEFEARISELSGRIEEVDHQNKLLAGRLDKLIADVDFRFRAIEKGNSPAPAEQGTEQAQPPAAQSGEGDTPTLGKPPGVLGTLRSSTPPDQPQAALTPPAPAVIHLPPGSPQSQYNFATNLLHQGDYAGAEQTLGEFIAQHPADPLASAAQYWLGETFFVRHQYDRAAKAFLAGYQKYPKSTKAPDDLLKLGMSLTALNQKKEACAVFQQLGTEYPNAETRVKQSAARERPKAGCS